MAEERNEEVPSGLEDVAEESIRRSHGTNLEAARRYMSMIECDMDVARVVRVGLTVARPVPRQVV